MSKRDKTSQKLLDSIRKTKEANDGVTNTTSDAAPASAPAPVLDAASKPAEQGPKVQGQQPQQPQQSQKPKQAQQPAEEPQRIFSSRRVWPD